MLYIRQVKHLARILDTSVARLSHSLDNAAACYEDLILHDPAKPAKERSVVSVGGEIRRYQQLLYRRLLLKKLEASPYSHGGVAGRHIKSNLAPHIASVFVFKSDISAFYPSIHCSRVYRLFATTLGCSPDVSRLCTRLCTYRFHLALGLITSPIIADQMMRRTDARIGAACAAAGLTYSRFVDDLTISGSYDLSQSGFESIVAEVLKADGFHVNPRKHYFGKLARCDSITGIRVNRGRFDVRREYAVELERQLDDALQLSRGKEFSGPFFTRDQIRGRIQFVRWINPARGQALLKKYRLVPWPHVTETAHRLGFIAARKTLRRVTAENP